MFTASRKDNVTLPPPLPPMVSATSTQPTSNVLDSSLKPKFSFQLNWNDMPLKAVQNLTKSENTKVLGCADTKDLSDLKAALRVECIKQYVTFRDRHPGQQLTPGLQVYKDITNMVTKPSFRQNLFWNPI